MEHDVLKQHIRDKAEEIDDKGDLYGRLRLSAERVGDEEKAKEMKRIQDRFTHFRLDLDRAGTALIELRLLEESLEGKSGVQDG